MLNLELTVFPNKRRNSFGSCFSVSNVAAEAASSIKAASMVFIVKFPLSCTSRLSVIFLRGLNTVKVDEVKYGNLCR